MRQEENVRVNIKIKELTVSNVNLREKNLAQEAEKASLLTKIQLFIDERNGTANDNKREHDGKSERKHAENDSRET